MGLLSYLAMNWLPGRRREAAGVIRREAARRQRAEYEAAVRRAIAQGRRR